MDFLDVLGHIDTIIGLIATAIAVISAMSLYVIKQHKRIDQLEKRIDDNGINLIKNKQGECVDEIFENVNEVKQKIISIIKDLDGYEEISILNLGLDLETIVGMLKYDFNIKNDMTYKCLVVNPKSSLIIENCTENISHVYAKTNIEKLKRWFEQHSKNKNIKLKIVSYSSLPTIHGFLVNNTHLFVGFTVFEKNGLAGGNYSYLYINRSKKNKEKFRDDIFKTYTTWFNYLFDNGILEFSSTN